MQPSDARKEKIKLHANFLNGLAMGVMLIGAFTPISRAAYDPTLQASTLGFMAVLAIVCFVVSGVLHYYATRVLNELKGLD
jgi:hypothetical protein